MSNYLTLPDIGYKYTGASNQYSDIYADYLRYLGNDYLPSLQDWSAQNRGQMVSFSNDPFLTVEDLVGSSGRAVMRGRQLEPGYFIGDNYSPYAIDSFGDKTNSLFGRYIPGDYENDPSPTYYYQDSSGVYQPVTPWDVQSNRLADGAELFTFEQLTPTLRDLWDTEFQKLYDPQTELYGRYKPTGAFRRETRDEALDRLFNEAPSRTTGGWNDFLSDNVLNQIATSHDEKWGKDYVNIPELAPLLKDPNWVQRDEQGNIVAVRSELMPYIVTQGIGLESGDLNRSTTKSSDLAGNLIKAGIIGIATGGLGSALAGGLGLTTSAGALTTAGKVVAGATAGGLTSAAMGGDPLKGALLGGAGGFIGSAFQGVGDSFVAADAANLLSSGLSPDQVASILQATHGIPSTAASTVVGLTRSGVTDPTLQVAAVKAGQSGTMTIAGGGSGEEALTSALTSGAGSAVGGKVGEATESYTGSDSFAKLLSKVAGGLTSKTVSDALRSSPAGKGTSPSAIDQTRSLLDTYLNPSGTEQESLTRRTLAQQLMEDQHQKEDPTTFHHWINS